MDEPRADPKKVIKMFLMKAKEQIDIIDSRNYEKEGVNKLSFDVALALHHIADAVCVATGCDPSRT